MESNTRNASAVIVAALAVATISSPAAAAPRSDVGGSSTGVAVPFQPAIVVDALGNLTLSGMSSDDVLDKAYGASPEEKGKLLADTNIGKCTITNNCKPPEQPEVQA